MEITNNLSDCHSPVVFKLIIIWLGVYILIDAAIFGSLYHLNLVFNGPDPSRSVGDLSMWWAYSLFGLVGKASVMPQYPIMLIAMLLFKNALVSNKLFQIILPLTSFIVAYILFLSLAILIDFSNSWDLVIRTLKDELSGWANYQSPLKAIRPIALLSAVIATIPWVCFLRWQHYRISRVSQEC